MANDEQQTSMTSQDGQPLLLHMGQTIRAGLPLESALRALAEQTQSRRARQTLVKLSEQLEQGIPLDQAMQSAKSGLSPEMNTLITAGLESGRLDAVMQYGIDQSQRSISLRRQIWLSLSYPLFLIWFAAVVCSLAAYTIIPAINDLYSSPDIELATTPLLANVANIMPALQRREIVWIGIAGLTLLAVTFLIGLSRWGHRWATSMPLIGPIFHYAALSDFALCMAILIDAGLPFSKAMLSAGTSSDDRWLSEKCRKMAARIDRGATASEAAIRARLPATLSQVLRETSSTPAFTNALRGLSDIYEARSRILTQFTTAIVTQFTIVIVVSFIVVTALLLFQPVITAMKALT